MDRDHGYSGRPIAPLRVTGEERERLEERARRPKTAQALAQRARMSKDVRHHRKSENGQSGSRQAVSA